MEFLNIASMEEMRAAPLGMGAEAGSIQPFLDGDDRARALLVGGTVEQRDRLGKELRGRVWAVANCAGPGRKRCPLIMREPCDVRSKADVAVVFSSPEAPLTAVACAAHSSSAAVMIVQGRLTPRGCRATGPSSGAGCRRASSPTRWRTRQARSPCACHYLRMKGDRVEVVVDVGGEGTKTYEIAATRAGRRVEVSNVRGTVEVAEVTRSGQVVRTARFMAARVVAIVEHPNADEEPRRKQERGPGENQASLGV